MTVSVFAANRHRNFQGQLWCGHRPHPTLLEGHAMSVVINFDGKPKTERVPSTIQFPYTDMADATAVAEGVLKGGGIALSRDQLAAAMGLAPQGGGFATKIATARMFGVIEATSGKYQLTDTGHEIVDTSRRADAMVRAFLNVELYRKIYEDFRGKRLPPRPNGLEAAFVNHGVSQKNVRAARLAFDKSARMAGFFHNGDEERLVMPFGVGPTMEQVDSTSPAQPDNLPTVMPARAAPTVGASLHPSIVGMLDELPPPKSDWSKAEQADWLDALATIFRVVYRGGGDRGFIRIAYLPPQD
jgi:hypothetical protein